MKASSANSSFKWLLIAAIFSLFSQTASAFSISQTQQQEEIIKASSSTKAFLFEDISINPNWLTENEPQEAVPFNYAGITNRTIESFKNLPTGNFYHYFQDKKLLLKNYIFPFHFFW